MEKRRKENNSSLINTRNSRPCFSYVRLPGPSLQRMAGAMVTLAGKQALYLGGSSGTLPFVYEDTVLELRSDLSGWDERTDLRLPKTTAWVPALVLDL